MLREPRSFSTSPVPRWAANSGVGERASVAELDAYILCGGLGTRLRSELGDRPKILAEVAGRPFLEILLELLAGQGLGRFVLCVGYLADAVGAERRRFERFGEIVISKEPGPLGTGGAIRNALPLGRSNPLLVLNGDSICPLPVAEMLEWHCQRRAVLTIAAVRASSDGDYGTLSLDAEGRIRSFVEKDSVDDEAHQNAGVYLIDRDYFERNAPEGAFSLEREFFPRFLGERAFAFVYAGTFLDIGTPERFRQAATRLKEQGLISDS